MLQSCRKIDRRQRGDWYGVCTPAGYEGMMRSGAPTGERPEAVRIWLLGGFRVTVGSRTVEENRWRLKKAGGLVKLLALAQGQRLHREQIMDALWPDLDTKSAANNLHHVLHFARRVLGATPPNTTSRYLQRQGDLLALCPEGPLWVDVEAFEEAAGRRYCSSQPGVRSIPGGGRTVLRRALARGPLRGVDAGEAGGA